VVPGGVHVRGAEQLELGEVVSKYEDNVELDLDDLDINQQFNTI
jgi:hypothetical protein